MTKTRISFSSYATKTTRTIYQVPYINTAAVHTAAAIVCSRYPDGTLQRRGEAVITETSHGHHLPARTASAGAARGRCFDPNRAATARACRACSARQERVSSLVGQDQFQAQSNSMTRSSLTTPDDGSHPPHHPPPMP